MKNFTMTMTVMLITVSIIKGEITITSNDFQNLQDTSNFHRYITHRDILHK